MVDLNDIAVFEKVASFHSFSAAARTLGLPKSSVSRAISRLEEDLGLRLFERSTRTVQLTPIGKAFLDRCADGLAQLGQAIDFAASTVGRPRGLLRISAGIGFGVNVLSQQLPGFLARHPEIQISLDLSSRETDLVADGVDVAVRMGALPDSSLVAVLIGRLTRHLCAAPAYLTRRGWPAALADLASHDTIEMPDRKNRPRVWSFTRDNAIERVDIVPRVRVNDALTIAHLVRHGVGIGILSGYLCAPALESGELVALFSEWRLEPIDVNLVFPSRREMSPAVRAFIDYMGDVSPHNVFWKRSART